MIITDTQISTNISNDSLGVELYRQNPKAYALDHVVPALKKGMTFSDLTQNFKSKDSANLSKLIMDLGYSIQELKKIRSGTAFNKKIIIERAFRAGWTLEKLLEEYQLTIRDLSYVGGNPNVSKWFNQSIEAYKKNKTNRDKGQVMKIIDTQGKILDPSKIEEFNFSNSNDSNTAKATVDYIPTNKGLANGRSTKQVVVKKTIEEHYEVELSTEELESADCIESVSQVINGLNPQRKQIISYSLDIS